MPQPAPQRTALEAGLNLIDQRRWADAVAALEQAQVETPGPAATYWLAQARFQHARYEPPISAVDRVAAWRTVAADLAAARLVAGTRVEVDVTLLDLETRIARVELLAALVDLGVAAHTRQPGARVALGRLAGGDDRAALPDGRWPGHWLVTLTARPGPLPSRCQAWLAHLGVGVWLGQATAACRRHWQIVGYFCVVVDGDADGLPGR